MKDAVGETIPECVHPFSAITFYCVHPFSAITFYAVHWERTERDPLPKLVQCCCKLCGDTSLILLPGPIRSEPDDQGGPRP